MITRFPVVIVGGDPSGLSLATYLRGSGVDSRIFGEPMLSWRTQMSVGMFLKFEGFAANPHGLAFQERFVPEVEPRRAVLAR